MPTLRLSGLRAPARAWSIRFKLAGLVGLGMLATALIVGSLLFATAHELILDQARSELRRQNQGSSHAIEDLSDQAATALLITRHSATLDHLFRAPPGSAEHATAAQDLLHELVYLQTSLPIDEICVIEATGQEAARVVQGHAAETSDLSSDETHNPFFAPALALGDGEVYRSIEPYVSPDRHRYVVAYATHILEADGQREGILHFELPLEWFTARVRHTTLHGASSFLLDRQGDLLAPPLLADSAEASSSPPSANPDSPFPRASDWGPPGFRAMASSMMPDVTASTSFSDNGETYEVVYRPVYAGRWILATIIPHSAIFAPVADLQRTIALMLLPVLLLGLAVTAWYAARLLTPLRRLADALSRVGTGDLDQHLGFDRADEIGQLGRAFDRMSGELRLSRSRQADAEDALRANEARYRQMFEGNQAVQILVDPYSGAIVDANPAAAAYYGYPRPDLLRRKISDLNTRPLAEIQKLMTQVNTAVRTEFVARHRLASGELRDVQVHSSPFQDGERWLLYSVIHDVTERLRAETALRHQALHDSLTNLPNRTLLYDRLDHAVTLAGDGRTFALLLLDLDRFKEVNDSLGHHAGDSLLTEVASRLRKATAAGDTVARLGGDEFAIVLVDADAAAAKVIAQRLRKALGAPVQVEHHDLDIGASIGIAMYPAHGHDARSLLKHADIAMYQAKRDGSGFSVFTAEQNSAVQMRLALAAALRKAIANDELTLVYQPKVDCRTGKLLGVEALARWNHPDLGAVAPDQFIRLAEEVGQIRPLTALVLNRALSQWHTWARAGVRIPIAVNLSAHDVQDARLPTAIGQLLGHWGVPASELKVEITESALVVDPTQAMAILSELCATGVRVAIDDFGTGYSSLAYLKQLPIHEIKIDRTFVHDMTTHSRDLAIVRSTIELARNLGLETVAEGVEDQATLDALQELGCDMVQGFHLSRPLAADDLLAWCRERDERSSLQAA